jgi:hypothetical protein
MAHRVELLEPSTQAKGGMTNISGLHYIDQIHQLFNELKKWFFAFNSDQREYVNNTLHVFSCQLAFQKHSKF